MSVRILTADSGEQVLYDSVTMTAFGVVHEDNDFELEDFLTWMPFDVRGCSRLELNDYYYKWLKEVQDERAIDQYDGGYEGDGKFAENH